MFLHIGNNIIVNSKDIVGIFNIKAIKNTNEYNKLLEDLKEKNNLNINNNVEQKTLIITKDKNEVKGYITNISSVTLSKRIQNYKNAFLGI